MKPTTRRALLFVVTLPLVVFACDDGPTTGILDPAAPDAESRLDAERAGAPGLSVLTWNVYYGADLDVLLEDGGFLPVQVAAVFAQVQATAAAERADAMAALIADAPPDLIGLQEVARYATQTPGDFLDATGAVSNPFPNADVEVFDFLDLLVDALAARDLDYVVASRTTTFDVELPMYDGSPLPPWSDLRLTESVAILARSDLSISNGDGDVFAVNLPVDVGGFSLAIVKGWASVDATVKGRAYRFVTTHLEPADLGPDHAVVPAVEAIQLAQAAEVRDGPADFDGPVILTGDLNTEPGGGSTDTYEIMEEAGFVDTWLVGRRRGAGFTANQSADLTNADSELWHRVDYVLYRDAFTAEGRPFRGSVHVERLGEEQGDRTVPTGLWPSDHAGVLVTLRAAQGRPD